MKKRKTYIVVTALFILYIIVVLCLCLINFSEKTPVLPQYIFGIPTDKAGHFIMFLAYPFASWLMFTYNKILKMRRSFVFPTIILTGLVFAAFTETAQGLFTTYREPDNMDCVADTIGILSCTFFIWAFQKPLKKLFDNLQLYFHRVLYK